MLCPQFRRALCHITHFVFFVVAFLICYSLFIIWQPHAIEIMCEYELGIYKLYPQWTSKILSIESMFPSGLLLKFCKEKHKYKCLKHLKTSCLPLQRGQNKRQTEENYKWLQIKHSKRNQTPTPGMQEHCFISEIWYGGRVFFSSCQWCHAAVLRWPWFKTEWRAGWSTWSTETVLVQLVGSIGHAALPTL